MGVDIGGDDDLFVLMIDAVERVEELFLSLLAPSEELDIVHQQDVTVISVSFPKIIDRVVLERPDKLVGELFCGEIDDLSIRLIAEDSMSDRVNQMCLAQPDTSINEEWIIARPW